jgi:ankyrin repeat protein
MHLAAIYGHMEVVKFLVHSNIDINIPNSEGQSSLYITIKRKNFELAKYLLSVHGQISAQGTDLAKTLCRAAADNDMVSIRLIVEGKGDLNCVDHLNRNFRLVALKHNRSKILSYLKTI